MPVEAEYCNCCGKPVRQAEPGQQAEGAKNPEVNGNSNTTEHNHHETSDTKAAEA
jgi:hypothetical protein